MAIGNNSAPAIKNPQRSSVKQTYKCVNQAKIDIAIKKNGILLLPFIRKFVIKIFVEHY